MNSFLVYKIFQIDFNNVFLYFGIDTLPKNYSINFQTPATFFMENIIRFHHDIMFYIFAAFPFVLFAFLELNIF